jgi:predicted  nucleic acid-binding Zn-ribbon protein
MPDFQEQLALISRLRDECRRCDDSLYRARLDLHRTILRLRRAEQSQTVVSLDRDRELAAVRGRIARLDARLSVLRDEERRITKCFADLAEQRQLVEHLQRKLAAMRNRIVALRRLLAELQEQEPTPEEEIRAVEEELARLEQAQPEVSAGLEGSREALQRLRDQEDKQHRRVEKLNREIEGLRGESKEAQGRLVGLSQPAFADRDGFDARRVELEEASKRLSEDCVDCAARLHEAVVALYGRDPHPRGPLRSLDDRTPFLLFPVRLETIFVPARDGAPSPGTELWVRIYPDEIAVHTHEKVLSEREVVSGELYWTELLAAEHLRDEREKRRRAAWGHLVDLFGGQRAAWAASQTKPADWDSLAATAAARTLIDLLRAADAQFFDTLQGLDMPAVARTTLEKALDENDGDIFMRLAEEQKWFAIINRAVRKTITSFPAHDLTKTDAWTRAPRTHVLPDRFALLLFGDEGAAPREVVGNPIPDTLFLGPDPLDPEGGFTESPDDGVRGYGGSFAWMSDFDKALEQGMGFRVSLSEAEARNGFAKVFVLGLRLSAGANDGAALLEELIVNHQFSPKGFSIVRQGTPTNNTERNGTGFSDNDPYDDLAFFTVIAPPAFDPQDPNPRKSQTDGRLLADALGISYAPMQTVQHADRTDLLEARSLNAALFPATWGYWLRRWMAPVVTEEDARQTRTFFTRFVSGRGALPAVRVGNQPYGVLLTSDFSRWKYRRSGEGPFVLSAFRQRQVDFLSKLHGLLAALQPLWDDIARALPFVGKEGSDSSDVLMNILGLHPTSVEFFHRVGYSHEYLKNLINFKDGGRFAGELNSHMLGMPAIARSFLLGLGIVRDVATVGSMQSLKVLWQHYTTALDVPNLVENKPPSEVNGLTVNYIERFATAEDVQKIISQDWPGGPPSSLLYLLLRNALLLQLHNGAYEWLKERTTFDAVLEQATRTTTLAGMRESLPTVSKLEIMATRVAVAEPASPVASMTVADWLWKGPTPTETEAAFLREQKAALLNLTGTPTASLERCLIEHLDCCNYRLDAWQTGLFAERLQEQRGAGQERQTGIYIGAFGWVEDLRQSVKTFLSADSLPPSLRPDDTRPILEEDEVRRTGVAGETRGGFVHAPSLSHAAAAALLRSAYLSHADPQRADMFAVNLSSERTRRAQFVLEGMRNGQPIEALLGYQFERGLHDRTSESAARGDTPVLELNQFILPYREAFTFESRELAQAGTGPAAAETVPPYSVVNGLTLADATLTPANAFGLASIVPPAEVPNADQGAAVLAEQDALLDTLDAVKDLLMAENAFQLARGNFDRVGAVSLAQKEARIPPELEVLNTPRGTEFTFTNRVTLHFDDLDPSSPSTNPWPSAPMSPRASAEPGMNKWLGGLLGSPERIFCEVYWFGGEEASEERDRHRISVADLGVQPVDFVWLVNISTEATQGATVLETRVAYRYRRAHGIPDDKVARIEFNPAVTGSEMTFAQFFPLARQLRALLMESRPLHAGDFLPDAGGKETAIPVDQANPKGYDVAELRARVQGTLNDLAALADSLDGPSAPAVEITFTNDPATPADDETLVIQLGAAFTKLEEVKLEFTDTRQVMIGLSLADAEMLHRTLRSVADFGIGDAFPPESDLTGDSAKAALLDRAHRTARKLRRVDPADGVLDRAAASLSKAAPGKAIERQVGFLSEAGRILFGDTFNWLPKFTCHNEIDLAAADAARDKLVEHAVNATPGMTKEELVEEWLQGLARVRRPLQRWEAVRTLADALSDASLELRPVQVPYRANDSWLAVEFPKTDPNNTDPEDPEKPFGISRDTLSIAAHGAGAFQVGVRQSGVLIDDWTEEIPTAQETTGIAFRFNQPNVAPPQALLLAVTPEQTGSWEWDDLVGTLSDTLRRAKRRAVEPAQLEKQGQAWNAFAPALVSEFSTLTRGDISLDLMTMMDFAALNDFYAKDAARD